MRVVVIPARNEESNLAGLIQDLAGRVDAVVVVNDASIDATGQIASDLGAVTLRNDSPLGYGASLRRGLLWCWDNQASAVITMDGDGQHEPKWIDESLPKLDDSADVIFANRFTTSEGVPETKLISNNYGWHCIKRCIGRSPICEDVSCGFRIYNRRAMLASLQTQADATSGYAFAQASCAQLYLSQLRMLSFPAPAIYSKPVRGTHVREMKDFFGWLQTCAPMSSEAMAAIACLDARQPLTLRFEDWRTGHLRVAIGRWTDDLMKFSIEA